MDSSLPPEAPPKKFRLALHWQILIALVLGTLVGSLFNYCGAPEDPSSGFCKATYESIPFWRIWLFSWMGELFLTLLKLIVIPLIFCALVNGIGHMSLNQLGKVGGVSILIFKGSMLIAAALGLFWVNLLKPGVGFDVMAFSQSGPPEVDLNTSPHLMDFIPDNFFGAISKPDQLVQVIFCALLFGIALLKVGERAKTLRHFFEELFVVMLKITNWIMRLAPFGVFGLLVLNVGNAGLEPFKYLAKYMITVGLGLASMLFIVTPLLVWLLGRMNPLTFLNGVKPAMFTAFSTSSTAATIPVSLDCVHKNLKVPFSVSSFVIPTAATMNMNGAALYEGVVTLFLAQAYSAIDPSINLSLWGQITILALVLLSTLGTPGIPHGGLITTAIVLKAVGLPLDALGMILAVDRILDMCRTMTNVTGDCASAVIINNLVGKDMGAHPEEELEPDSII